MIEPYADRPRAITLGSDWVFGLSPSLRIVGGGAALRADAIGINGIDGARDFYRQNSPGSHPSHLCAAQLAYRTPQELAVAVDVRRHDVEGFDLGTEGCERITVNCDWAPKRL